MVINKANLYNKIRTNWVEITLAAHRAKIARGFAIMLNSAIFALLGKVISVIGIYTLGSDFIEIFEPLTYIGLTTGFVIGIICDLDEFYKDVIKFTYYGIIGIISVGLGVLLGWSVMYFFA
ncbi:MAG: hypothetical protein KDJ97_02590 [Anaerolineae bacterium]|nr:hypothetical protein [Anaerolineae bacterium]